LYHTEINFAEKESYLLCLKQYLPVAEEKSVLC